MPKQTKRESRRKAVKAENTKQVIKSIKRPLKDYQREIAPVKYRFLRRRYNLSDDDLLTKEEFRKLKQEMYGKGG